MNWLVFGQQVGYGISNGIAYGIFGAGLAVVFGVMGIINIAHGELYMIGAMVTASLMASLGMNFFLAVVIAVAVAGAVGILVNRVAIQPLVDAAPLSILLSTIAVSFILLHGSAVIWGTFGKDLNSPFDRLLHLGGMGISEERVVLSVIGAIVIAGLYLFLRRTRIGKLVQATAQDRVGARLVGINVKWVYGFTFGLSSALAAVAGVILGTLWVAEPFMGQAMLMKGFVVVIVGGMGNIPGCIAVGLLIGIIEALFKQYVSPAFSGAFVFGIMVVVLALKPEGLFAGRR